MVRWRAQSSRRPDSKGSQLAIGPGVWRPPAERSLAGSGAKTDEEVVSNTPGTDNTAANEAQ